MDNLPGRPDEPARSPSTGAARTIAVLANRAVYWISRHWLGVINVAVAIYVGLPFLAPVLMKAGIERPARVLYTIYSPACHQMGFRSWFLFGDQAYYPLRATGLEGVRYFEDYATSEPAFAGLDPNTDFARYSWAARGFAGSEQMGYKVALCQRDVAIYLSLLAGGLLFALLRRYVKPLPWQLFVLFGVIPMGIDGGYQLLTYLLNSILPIHETVPWLRTLTGALFGLGLAWLTFPQINLGMQDTERHLFQKLSEAGLLRGEEA